MRNLYLLLLLLPFNSFSKNFEMSAAAILRSNRVYRGALLWPGPLFFPGVQLKFYEKFILRGPNLLYSHFDRKDSYVLDLNLNSVNGGKPLIPLSSHKELPQYQRENALDLSLNLRRKFGYRKSYHGGFLISQELVEYKRYYFEMQFGMPIYKFTTLDLSYGHGHRDTNKYLFGMGSKAGASNITSNITNMYRDLPWEGMIITSLGYSHILQTENKHASFTQGDGDHFTFGMIFIWNFED